MIPKWRYVEYTDDGCEVCQCLACYHRWEGRTSAAGWAFCPYCGVRWQGQEVWDEDAKAKRKVCRRLEPAFAWKIEAVKHPSGYFDRVVSGLAPAWL